jgi:hypothetical protein
MKSTFAVIAATLAVAVLALGTATHAAGTTILFIGNSFTFGSGSAVRFYRNNTVTDLNNEGVGGVPALFKSFTDQAGLDYDVSLETRGGVGLDFHLENKLDVLGTRGYDTVVAHGYSTLDQQKPRDPAKLIATAKQMGDFLRSKNPNVKYFLTATWSRADQVYPEKGDWAGTPIETMGKDVRAAYDKAAAASGAKVIAVGDAWNRAFATGFADRNPYDGIEAGKVNLWTTDSYHASTYGYYLEALMVFGSITGKDPRSLTSRECSGFELGLPANQVTALQQLAFDELAVTNAVTPNPPEAGGRRQAAARCAVKP